MPYLSPRALKGLKQYQYKSGGYTLLDQIHTPIWNGTVCTRVLSEYASQRAGHDVHF